MAVDVFCNIGKSGHHDVSDDGGEPSRLPGVAQPSGRITETSASDEARKSTLCRRDDFHLISLACEGGDPSEPIPGQSIEAFCATGDSWRRDASRVSSLRFGTTLWLGEGSGGIVRLAHIIEFGY